MTAGAITLRNGPTVALAAIELVLDLEHRGCDVYRDNSGQLHLAGRFTWHDRAAVARLRGDVVAIVDYCDRAFDVMTIIPSAVTVVCGANFTLENRP